MTKTESRAVALVCAGLLLVTVAARAQSVGDGNRESGGEEAVIEGVLRDSFCWAFTKDRELLESVLAKDERLFMFNPDSRNTVVGWDSFTKAFDIWMDPRFESTRFDMRDLRINLSRSKDVAWYSAIIDDCGKWEGRELCWTDARWTGVLEKRDARWRIVQMHISLATDQTEEKSTSADGETHSD